MAISKAPKKDPVDQFIKGAPDAQSDQANVPGQQNKRPITITFDPALLAQLDAAAKRIGISRSAAFAVAVSQWLGIEHS